MKELKRDGMPGNYWFVDGNKASEHFYDAAEYARGFVQVQKTSNSPRQWRDLLGRLTDVQTASGREFYRFCIKEISLHEISGIHFADEVFCKGIKDEIISQAKEEAKYEFAAGRTVSKEDYRTKIECDFDYIERVRKEALERIAILKRTEDECKNAEKARQDAYDDTMEFLNNL
ncbi:MAG: hypothetical protein IJY90_00195 [Clostridia bacterium]|nr:hypothetical protein [Clostridia bacterium]